MSAAKHPAIARRSLGAAAIGAALGAAGCAPAPTSPNRTSPAPEPSTPEPSAAASAEPTPSPSLSPSPSPAGPDPDEVARRFADVEASDWGMDLPGIVSRLDEPRTADGRPRVALTLDACGGRKGSAFDAELVDGLVAAGVPFTLFLNLRWIDANPQLVTRLVAEPLIELGNHGTRHVPLSVTGREAYGIAGTASAREAVDEVWECHERLTALTGVAPRLFRAGTAHYDDVGVEIVRALGAAPIGFSTNGDAGATFDAATVHSEVAAVAPGGIVIAHANRPDGETAEGLLAAVHDLLAEDAEFVLL